MQSTRVLWLSINIAESHTVIAYAGLDDTVVGDINACAPVTG